jgi:hypothetical protein
VSINPNEETPLRRLADFRNSTNLLKLRYQMDGVFVADKRRSREITLNETGQLGFAHPLQQAASVIAPEL